MKFILITISGLLLFVSNSVIAQHARFATEGVIEFEKTINMQAYIKKMINAKNETFVQPMLDQYKKNQPQFKVLKSSLSFSKDRTLFKPESLDNTSIGFVSFFSATGQQNIVYTDITTSTSISHKKVFEETFLVKDSTRKINWKITSETREIAGYPCRRANAIIMDSIYVVAFYTDKIPVSGGPESFSGLPGMILGVAMPHENITWFAKTVTDKPVASNMVIPPSKGKVKTYKELLSTLETALKNWEDWKQPLLKGFLL